MPVVITLTTIRLLMGGGSEEGLPFSDPSTLRGLLNNALAGEADDTLKKALRIADELETLLNRYSASVESSIDAYIEESSNRYTAAQELIERFKPLDHQRSQTLQKVIELRQSLFELLNDEQWEDVFN